ncbi:MAG: hypothetical protein AAF551_08510 [Bacteroidota bacterium]
MMKIFQPFLQHSISLKRKTSFFCIASILLISIGTVQGQAIGKPFGNTLNFFDTNNSGGLLGHLESGTFGVFSSGNQWIGIGQPFTMINGSTKVPAYGFRSQWEGQAGIFALTGSGTVKDLTVQWGANPNSKVRFNYASDLMNPSAVTEVLTLLPNGNVGIGRSNPSEALDINGSMALNGSIIGSGLQIDLNAGTNPKRITSNQLGGNSSMELQTFNDDIDELQTRILLRGTSGDIEFYDRTSELLAVFDGESGNVGIDTDSPSEKLDVNGNMALSGDIIGSTFQLDLSAGTNPKRITSNQLGGASTMELQTFNDDIEELQTRILLRGGGSSDIEFYDETSELFVKFDGESKRVGIGTSSPSEKLEVNGNIKADGNIEADNINASRIAAAQVQVALGSFPDYVFADDYNMMPLNELEAYIDANKHLPEMPSEAEVLKNGIELGRLNTLLVEKIEELTLHMISLNKEIELLKNQN